MSQTCAGAGRGWRAGRSNSHTDGVQRTNRPTVNTPTHMTHWKNMPSPVGNFFVTTKLEPKHTMATPAMSNPTVVSEGIGTARGVGPPSYGIG